MKIIYILTFFLLINAKSHSCEYFSSKGIENIQNLMGKKSKIYDAYRQGKCVLENALEPLTDEQRKIIANLIAKSYTEIK